MGGLRRGRQAVVVSCMHAVCHSAFLVAACGVCTDDDASPWHRVSGNGAAVQSPNPAAVPQSSVNTTASSGTTESVELVQEDHSHRHAHVRTHGPAATAGRR